MNKTLIFIIPVGLCAMLLGLFWQGLGVDTHKLPSVLVGQPVPTFHLPKLDDPTQQMTHKEFQGKVSMLTVWATWCGACVHEHRALLAIADTHAIPLYGLVYKDDRNEALRFLVNHGNPFVTNLLDDEGNTAIDWGVYGTPETYIIDQKGIIRYRHIGVLTMNDWVTTLQPLVQQLQNNIS